MADLIPSQSAAGFEIGADLDSTLQKVGPILWYDKTPDLDETLSLSTGWIGLKTRHGLPGGPYTQAQSLVYMNNVVCLEFEDNLKLYKIDVGLGYEGCFLGIKPGNKLRSIEKEGLNILFNDMDDEFLLVRNERPIEGISFLTDYRTSLENAPDQTIHYISIHDWSLR
ncbi:hypothetical protein [Pseudomonas xanthosomatis]|uniref:hypothetical protein n=1 Tax=Pseudomonas xanthosomatis TaxID=2842356 RepID=UPI00351647AC